MAGVVLIDDDFATLGTDVSLSGRAPPVRDNTTTYGVDPSAGAITGAGSSTIKFNATGATFKVAASSENIGVQLIYNDHGGNEYVVVFLRDQQSTPAQRYGFAASFSTRAATPFIRIMLVNNYTPVQQGSDIPWTFSPTGINKVALEAINQSYRVIVNDVVAHTFTQSSYAPNGLRTRCGVQYGVLASGASVSTMRGSRFTIFDSIADAAPSAQYPVVRFG